MPATAAVDADPVAHAKRLLDATRSGDGVDEALADLAALSRDEPAPLRDSRETALAFWLNVYNAGTQVLAEREPERYRSVLRTWRFFGVDCVTVGGTALSLDEIEHGILRGSRSKYGLGYLPKLLVSSFEREYRLAAADPRLHFAVNCAAESCPPIRYYEADRIDEQLDLATESYLDATVEYDPDAGTVAVPRVFRWYPGDFEDPIAFLRDHGVLPAGASPSVEYLDWDWSMRKKAFVED